MLSKSVGDQIAGMALEPPLHNFPALAQRECGAGQH